MIPIYIYHFDTSDQRKPQGYVSHITLTTEQYQLISRMQDVHSRWGRRIATNSGLRMHLCKGKAVKHTRYFAVKWRRNFLPARITLLMKDNFPTKESSWDLVHLSFCLSDWIDKMRFAFHFCQMLVFIFLQMGLSFYFWGFYRRINVWAEWEYWLLVVWAFHWARRTSNEKIVQVTKSIAYVHTEVEFEITWDNNEWHQLVG